MEPLKGRNSEHCEAQSTDLPQLDLPAQCSRAHVGYQDLTDKDSQRLRQEHWQTLCWLLRGSQTHRVG